jgi:hypothetical protein
MPNFVASKFVNEVNMEFGTKKWGKFVYYNLEFIIIEFVITKFGCT